MAHALGLPLHEYLGWPGPTTHRQHLAWCAYLEWRQWHHADKLEYYLMALRADVIRTHVKDPRSVTVESMRLPFERVKPAAKSDADRVFASKAAWLAGVGLPVSLARGKGGE